VTSLPFVVPEAPLGIVIRTGSSAPKPTAIWAYVWTDDRDGDEHWHDLLPKERAA
jgi:hypothetical protein